MNDAFNMDSTKWMMDDAFNMDSVFYQNMHSTWILMDAIHLALILSAGTFPSKQGIFSLTPHSVRSSWISNPQSAITELSSSLKYQLLV